MSSFPFNDPWAVSVNMFDAPGVPHLPFYETCKLAEGRLDVLKGIQRFFERRKDQEVRNFKFYDDLGSEITRLVERSPVFASGKNDMLSHWMVKTAFVDYDPDPNFVPFYEKILFAGRLWNLATKQAIADQAGHSQHKRGMNVEGQMTADKAEAEDDIGVASRTTLETARDNKFFDMLCEYMGLNPKEMPTVEKEVQVWRNGERSYETSRLRYLMVPFKFAVKAMETYDVELYKGQAQITPFSAFIVLQDSFEETLKTHRRCLLSRLDHEKQFDPRIGQMVASLLEYKKELDSSNEVHYNKGVRFEELDADSVPQMAPYFPVCMMEIHDALRRKHHLKHMGRLQFMSFMKGLGMEVKQAVRLFTIELNKTEKGRKQVKEYTYLIEHMYGLQGKKTDYSPWSCQKIIGKGIPSGDEAHGCPYKFYSDQALIDLLEKKRGMKGEQVKLVLEARKVDAHMGCRKEFELTHQGAEVRKGIGKHPLAYFDSSYKFHEVATAGCFGCPKGGKKEDKQESW